MAGAEEFDNFCARVGCTSASSWWLRLTTLFSGPNRHYHTGTHIDDLTTLWRESKPVLLRPDAVLAAIYFHDAVYDPRAPDNEEQSAALYLEFLKEVKESAGIADVHAWILATKDHRRAAVTDSDLAFFLDMDLAILGSNRATYEIYAKNIRREYIHVPEEVYRTKRAEILQNFQNADDLYRSPLKERFAAVARDNLQWEIELLRSTRPLL